MNTHQHTVLTLALLALAVRLIATQRLQAVWAAVFGAPASSTPEQSANTSTESGTRGPDTSGTPITPSTAVA